MGQVMFSVRMDEDLKKEFEALCIELGMNMSTAIDAFEE
jgi:DNA-damage-inducible protein J